ncbi:MAG: Hsp20/alpha crystallin family protein [Candidatus Nitrohelix vancouverensis]|uniref:Hsp20/alpha crystallin family protein n=1 Tax=Candidatus Nitrohelix vancouverensis TaxID=2705534 RepID=A0A7T0C4F8_9BACT|nr:MAG: Hsp20/alpha crystallin family protein [Candidatus Nitrohelix vancouverensis]
MLLDSYTNWETWDPFREINQLQEEVNRRFSNRRVDAVAYPKVNIWQTDEGCTVTCELPGLSPEDLDISVKNRELTLKGERKTGESTSDESYFVKERSFGKFSRTIKLPFRVDSDKTEAHFKNGILTISLRLPEEDKPKTIAIQSH